MKLLNILTPYQINKLSKRKSHHNQIKRAKRFMRELDDIRDLQKNLGYIVLPTPRLHGWTMEFAIRDDFSRSPHAKSLEKILRLLNDKLWCKNKNFMFENYKTKRMDKRYPEFKKVSKRQMEEFIKKGYIEEWEVKKYLYYSGHWTTDPRFDYYNVSYPYMFDYKIKRNYITEIKVYDPDLESKEDYYRRELFDKRLFSRFIYGKKSNRSYYNEEIARKRRKMERRKMREEIDEYKNSEYEL